MLVVHIVIEGLGGNMTDNNRRTVSMRELRDLKERDARQMAYECMSPEQQAYEDLCWEQSRNSSTRSPVLVEPTLVN